MAVKHRPWLQIGLALTNLAAALVMTVSISAAASAEGHGVHTRLPETTPLALGRPVMHLGLPAEDASNDSTAAPKTNRKEQCRRWTSVAASLGDTFAGHALRSTLVRRHCAFIDVETNDIWDWPWNSLEQGSVAPPTLHRAFGPWQIRCAIVGERRRCALMHVATEPDQGATGATTPHSKPMATHFVIDRVTGQEVLLWRLFVPAPTSSGAAVVDATGSAVPLHSPAKSPISPTVRFRIADRRVSERFPACTPAGCMLEVRAKRAGLIATDLAAGKSLTLDFNGEGSAPARLVVPARGYQAGLAELIRLRRAETADKDKPSR